MHFGVDYYPEHWPEERWTKDAKLMASAGVNVVRLAEFAWCRLEPQEGKYNWDWLHRCIRLLASHNIEVVLGTPTATLPPWLLRKYPEMIQVDARGRRYGAGVRHYYCKTNPDYLREADRITRAVCKEFREEPNLIGWQIDNELGGGAARCHCKTCASGFREWLKARYGAVDVLNKAWGTVFWSHEYGNWDEVPLPVDAWGPAVQTHNPGLLLDFYRFTSEVYVRFLNRQAAIVREICPNHFVTTNCMGTFPYIDYFELAHETDFVCLDNYPGSMADPHGAGLSHDFLRGVKKAPYWVIEQQSGPTGWGVMSPAPKPGEIRAWTYQCVAHGAKAIVYYRWRPCLSGREQYWHGILDHDGSPGRRYEEIAAIGEELVKLDSILASSQIRSRVGIFMPYDIRWAFDVEPSAPGMNFMSHFREHYDALVALGANVDILNRGDRLSGYDLVVAPCFYLIDRNDADRFQSYVEKGGRLVLTFRSAVKDLHQHTIELPFPAYLARLFGVAVREYDALPQDQTRTVEGTVSPFFGHQYEAECWCDIIDVMDAEVLAAYAADYYAGKPAATRHRVGKGCAYYLATNLDEVFYNDLYGEILQELGLGLPSPLPPEVDWTNLEADGRRLHFVINLSNTPTSVNLALEYHDLLTGKTVEGDVNLTPWAVHILEKVKSET